MTFLLFSIYTLFKREFASFFEEMIPNFAYIQKRKSKFADIHPERSLLNVNLRACIFKMRCDSIATSERKSKTGGT
jgi:hypothetical protein